MVAVSNLQPISPAERAIALCNAIEKLPPSTQQTAISVQASQLAMMLQTQSDPKDRYRLSLSLEFDDGDACIINAEGTRQDMERLRARIGYWSRLEQACSETCERRRSTPATVRDQATDPT